MKTKEEVLALVSQWIDAVCQSPSGDLTLRIEKQAYGRDQNTGALAEVAFVVKSETLVAMAQLPMAKQLVPPPGLVLPK